MEGYVQIKKGSNIYQGDIEYQDGDIIEVFMKEEVDIAVKEVVSCRLFLKEKQFDIKALIIAKKKNCLYLFYTPPNDDEHPLSRRRYPRIDTSLKGTIEKNGQIHSCEVINVSVDGVALLTMNPMAEAGDTLKIDIHLDGFSSVTLVCSVIYAKPILGKYYRFGCNISRISGEDLQVLRKYILGKQLEQRFKHHSFQV